MNRSSFRQRESYYISTFGCLWLSYLAKILDLCELSKHPTRISPVSELRLRTGLQENFGFFHDLLEVVRPRSK